MQKLHAGAEFAPAVIQLEDLQRYVRLEDSDARLLLAFRPVAAPHFERIARELFERARDHEQAYAVLTGEPQIARLQLAIVAWLGRLLSGVYDAAYAEDTRALGLVHVRVGLPQRYLFTAMSLIRVALEAITDTLIVDAPATRAALTRVLDLELALMAEGYRDHLAGLVRRADEGPATAGLADPRVAPELSRIAIDLVPELVIGIDEQLGVRFVNQAARTITGYADDELLGAPFVALLVPEDLQPASLRRLAAARGGGPTPPEPAVIRTRAGERRDLMWSLSPLGEDPSRGGVEILIVGADITSARLVAQRVQREQKLVAIGTLAAGLAHEIRNPLNAAQLHVSFLKRLLDQHADREAFGAVVVVGEEIKRLARLVSEFLAFAEPRALIKAPTVIQVIVARAVAAAAVPPGIAVVISAPEADLVVVADAALLELVMLHLIENAVEALAPAGTGEIAIRARREPRAIVLEVEDDGPGFSSPDAPVFDAFFSTKPSGSGLGLAVAHRAITDHGGTIDVDSRPGRTWFRVALPLDDELRAPPAVRA